MGIESWGYKGGNGKVEMERWKCAKVESGKLEKWKGGKVESRKLEKWKVVRWTVGNVERWKVVRWKVGILVNRFVDRWDPEVSSLGGTPPLRSPGRSEVHS